MSLPLLFRWGNIYSEWMVASSFEAARLDGAGRTREFVAITLPSLRGQIAVALTLTVAGVISPSKMPTCSRLTGSWGEK